jgi:hypothetical protein
MEHISYLIYFSKRLTTRHPTNLNRLILSPGHHNICAEDTYFVAQIMYGAHILDHHQCEFLGAVDLVFAAYFTSVVAGIWFDTFSIGTASQAEAKVIILLGRLHYSV